MPKGFLKGPMLKVISHSHPTVETAADVNKRYPYRVPEWFWQNADQAFLLSAEDYIIFAQDIEKLTALKTLENSNRTDTLEDDIARRLASEFSVRDLARSGLVARSERN